MKIGFLMIIKTTVFISCSDFLKEDSHKSFEKISSNLHRKFNYKNEDQLVSMASLQNTLLKDSEEIINNTNEGERCSYVPSTTSEDKTEKVNYGEINGTRNSVVEDHQPSKSTCKTPDKNTLKYEDIINQKGFLFAPKKIKEQHESSITLNEKKR